MISKTQRSTISLTETKLVGESEKKPGHDDLSVPPQAPASGAWIECWRECAEHIANVLAADCCFILEKSRGLNLGGHPRQVCSCGHFHNVSGHLMGDPLILEATKQGNVVRLNEALHEHPYNRIIHQKNQTSMMAVLINSVSGGTGFVVGLISQKPWNYPAGILQRLTDMSHFATRLMQDHSEMLEEDHFFQISNDALMRVCSDGTITRINRRVEKLTGYKNGELNEAPISRLFPGLECHDLTKMTFECALNSRDHSKSCCQNTVKLHKKTGELILVELAILGMIPTVHGSNDVIVTIHDRSERQKLVTIAREVSDFSNEILSIVGAYVFVVDAEGRIVRYNQECERISGILFEEVVGEPLWEIIPDAQSHRRELERYRERPNLFLGPSSHKSTWTDKDGKKHNIQWRNSVIKDEDKKLKYLICCGVDVTEQDTSRKIIKRDGKLLSQFIRYAPAAVAMFDIQFNYLEASLRWKSKFDMPEEGDCVGQNPLDLHSNLGVFDNWRVALHECLNGHHKKSSRDTYTRHDGNEEVIRWEMQPWYDEESRPGGVIIFAEIITELVESEKSKRTLEQQLYRAQKLEAIGTMAGGVAHDFNNILAGIVGFTELLKIEFAENKFANELTTEVLKATDRAKMLVKQILAFSRNQEQSKTPASLKPIVKEATRMIQATCSSHITITANILGDIPFVMCDQNQIHQVLVNLCTNSIHAMEDMVSGKLTIQLECIQIEKEEANTIHKMKMGPYLKLTIKDTGAGMDEATLQRIFDPFFTTKEAGRGTGLGLSVVHGIVKSHDGHIRVTSKKNKGTCFDIYLPAISEQKVRRLQEKSTHLYRGNGERILFVDNEESICQSSRLGLEKVGFNVEVFTDPCLAFQRFAESPETVDILITDLDMPSITGIDLASKIKSMRPDLPMLLCSGFISEKLRHSKSMNIFEAILAKPNKLADLCSELEKIFSKTNQKTSMESKESKKDSDESCGDGTIHQVNKGKGFPH
jgi:PAS domain S-box-containing protein